MKRRAWFCIALALFTLTAFAEVPSPEQFLGYRLGDRFTPHHRIIGYFEELAGQSDVVTLERIGETYEHRPLVLAAITSAKNHAAIEEIRRNVATLANGEGDIEAIAPKTPAIVWLAFGIHGNESSSSEASMLVAYNLITDPAFSAMLDDVVVIIDPLENPDGRERYIEWYGRARGEKANSKPEGFEHYEPWPGGRYNHYLIDMNRDWTWLSQKETQARVAAFGRWHPQVFVDFHEMFYRSTYFFPPDAKPLNAHLPKDVEHWLDVFGKANAAEFSKRGWPFFVAETFDLFYPGYGDSWPSLHGAIGMTYEVAGGGRAGTAIERPDGTVLTLSDRIRRHYTTGMTTVRTAAQNREALLRYTYRAARAHIEADNRTFLIVPGSPNFGSLVSLLQKESIRVERLPAAATIRATRVGAETAESHSFPAGTAIISTRQPLGGLADTLLEEAPAFSSGFVEEQRTKTEADQPDDFYDLTTWSLPLAMNVEGWSTTANVATTAPFQGDAPVAFHAASYGYLVDGLAPNLYKLVGRLLEQNIKFNVADSEIVVGNAKFARGTLIVLKGNNADDLDVKLAAASTEESVAIVPLDSGWLGGTALGSEKIHPVENPKIGLVGGPGSDPTSYGMLWHTLDVDTPIPHTTLSIESLGNIDLGDLKVLVFPDGNYANRLGKRAIERIKQWARDGGTVVAVKRASELFRDKDVAMSKIEPWKPPKKKDDEAEPPEERYNDFRVPGSAFRTSMNEHSYLTFGLPRPPAVLVEGSSAFLPLPHKVDNIITIEAKNPLISGVAWQESIDRLAGSVYVASEPFGRGQVITFADDPHFRLFWRATLPIFLNAVVYSPSFPR